MHSQCDLLVVSVPHKYFVSCFLYFVISAWTQSLVSILVLLVELSVYVLILFSEVKLFNLQINWEDKTLSSQTSVYFSEHF